MQFTLMFLEIFFLGIFLTSPILIFLVLVVAVLGLVVGRHEGWPRFDALYWSCITATTVGYGDLRPSRRVSKSLAVLISLVGLVLTGILVSIALHSLGLAFEKHVDVTALSQLLEQSPEKQ